MFLSTQQYPPRVSHTRYQGKCCQGNGLIKSINMNILVTNTLHYYYVQSQIHVYSMVLTWSSEKLVDNEHIPCFLVTNLPEHFSVYLKLMTTWTIWKKREAEKWYFGARTSFSCVRDFVGLSFWLVRKCALFWSKNAMHINLSWGWIFKITPNYSFFPHFVHLATSRCPAYPECVFVNVNHTRNESSVRRNIKCHLG